MSASVLWHGGRVFTGARYVEALLVEDDRILAAGALDELRRLAPTGAEHRALRGRLIVPGLVDAHLHLAELARVRLGLDLSDVRSKEALFARLAEWAERHPDRPVVGHGWDPERGAEPRWPDRSEIDRAVRDRPAVVYHSSGHAAVVNSAALEALGVDPDRPAPDGPEVGRFGDGRPNGQLFESALDRLPPVFRSAEPIGPEELAGTLATLGSLGITAIGAIRSSAEEVRGLAALDGAGRLPITVRAYLPLAGRGTTDVRPGAPAAGRFAVAGVKAFLDGAFGPRTAWLKEPYADSPGTAGLAVGEEDRLAQELEESVERGLAPALHAIGDRAIARAVRLLAPLVGRTHAPARIEHAALTTPDLLPALDRVRPTLVVQPGFVWSDRWLPERLGARRAMSAYLFRTLRMRGLRVAGSSDAPFDPPDPWRGLRASVRRRSPDGGSANPDPAEALSAEEALSLYTAEAADALGLAAHGRLAPGAPADLLVLAVPGLAEALDRSGPPVHETWSAGRCVYRAPGPGEP